MSAPSARWRSRSTRAILTRPATPSASARCRSPSDAAMCARRGAARSASARRAPPRHRQDRHQRSRPDEARPLDRGGIRNDQAASRSSARESCAACRFSSRTSRSSNCTTSAPTARAIRTACAATEIPLVASIVHVADAFDAMTSARAYRPARATSRGPARAVAVRRHPVRRRSRARARQGAS